MRLEGERTELVKKIAKFRPAEHGLPFSTWSLAKLADFLVAQGVVDDISHEGLRILLREEGVSFQRVKTWKASRDDTTKPVRMLRSNHRPSSSSISRTHTRSATRTDSW